MSLMRFSTAVNMTKWYVQGIHLNFLYVYIIPLEVILNVGKGKGKGKGTL